MKKQNPSKKKSLEILLERAIAIAVDAHRGQRDKNGGIYIMHPLRLMMNVRSEEEKIVAVLHDVVEDTPWTFADLRREGFPKQLLVALDCVTKREGESYQAFVERSAGNPIARRVKIADLEDNMNVRRLAEVTPKDGERLARYLIAWRKLTELENRAEAIQ
jgi:(p)ppGpp synthase/HD superfamily hydrolase